jgi:hypothetical protein
VPLTQLLILPRVASMAQGESRTLAARAVFSHESIRLESDVSARATWSSTDDRIAIVSPEGILIAQAPGNARVNCRFEDLSARTDVRVESHGSRDVVVFFEGIRRVSQIDCDSNGNLYISNQSESIFEIQREGGTRAILSLARQSNAPQGIDCLHLADDGRLFVNSIGMNAIQAFEKHNGIYEPTRLLGGSRDGPKKCVASLSGTTFIGGMARQDRTGFVIIAPPAAEELSFSTRRLVIYLCVDETGNIYTTDNSAAGVDVYSPSGQLVETIAYPPGEAAGPLLFDGAHRLHIGTASGSIWRLVRRGSAWEHVLIARGLGQISGLAIDSRGYIFASDFTTGRISMIYPE